MRGNTPWIPAGLFCLACLVAPVLFAGATAASPAQLLERAENLKTSDHVEFGALLKQLEGGEMRLSAQEQLHLRYLRAFQIGYGGHYDSAISLMNSVIEQSADPILRFRASATSINFLEISAHYEEAFSRLHQLLLQLPQISDQAVRLQILSIATQLYIEAGQYDLATQYVDPLVRDSPAGKGECKAMTLKLQVLYKSRQLQSLGNQFQSGIDSCVKAGEPIFVGAIQSFVAGFNLQHDRVDDAIKLLKDGYGAVKRTRYPPLISTFDAMLAEAYWRGGKHELARQYALDAIANGIKNEYTESVTTAYRMLYLVDKEQGDALAALASLEKYTEADKGYLSDVSARALAFQVVNQKVLAKKLQVDTLAKQNKILQLQQALSKKAVEAGRLWIILLVLLLCSIGFITYRIRRSQLKFMKLARRDGLTGIFNRQHFVGEAERLLQYCRKSDRVACLVLLDLDHFKQVNDTHGHAVGDRVLRRAVAACQAHLRSTDLFGRLGGEEFGVLLPECGLDQAVARVEQIRLAIASVSLGEDAPNVAVSASFGVATVANSGYELRQLMTDADDALYEAKREGRNRVNLSSSRHVQLSLV
ncbi:GGDEF domain-containing protein [Rhodanobacter sp. FW102-FHT14D06]|uniref:diguanylate cyclase n=2 Tax=unclassified Rhodanobacter TaxID=2621553 RepID=A0AB74UXC2_9GAMM